MISDVAIVLAGGLLPTTASWLGGRAITRSIAGLPESVRFGVGAATLVQAYFLLLATGQANPWTLSAAALIWTGAGVWFGRYRLERIHAPWWTLLILIPYGVLYLVHALAPEIQPDGYSYHLGQVKETLRSGGFGRHAGFYELMPQAVESLYTGAASIGGHSAAKLVHAAFISAGTLTLATLAASFQKSGWTTAVIWFTAPVIGITGTSAYNDVALAFCVFSTAYLMLKEHAGLTGVMAGFCYAVKLPGLVIVAAVLGSFAIRRRWRDLGRVAAGAAVMIAPWMVRALVVSGNPVAPLYPALFPTDLLHQSVVEETVTFLRSYGVPWMQRWQEATIGGAKTGGLAGPVFLLTPLSLLALRTRKGALLCTAAFVTLIPWFFNAGTRFLIPALGFIAIALTTVVARRIAIGLAFLQAILSWPSMVGLYADPHAWRLRGFPWKAAVRVESEADYLHRELPEYRIAEMVNRYTRQNDVVLDLRGTPTAYTNAIALPWWQYAQADRARDAIEIASAYDQTSFYEVRAVLGGQDLSGIRIENTIGAAKRPWSLQEVQIFDRNGPVRPRLSWEFTASPNPAEAALAIDGNRATRWQSWQVQQPGMFWEARFGSPITVAEVRVLAFRSDAISLRWQLLRNGNTWTDAHVPVTTAIPTATSLRRAAIRYAKRAGFGWILAPATGEGLAPLGRQLIENPGDWGLIRRDNAENTWLLQINQP